MVVSSWNIRSEDYQIGSVKYYDFLRLISLSSLKENKGKYVWGDYHM